MHALGSKCLFTVFNLSVSEFLLQLYFFLNLPSISVSLRQIFDAETRRFLTLPHKVDIKSAPQSVCAAACTYIYLHGGGCVRVFVPSSRRSSFVLPDIYTFKSETVYPLFEAHDKISCFV